MGVFLNMLVSRIEEDCSTFLREWKVYRRLGRVKLGQSVIEEGHDSVTSLNAPLPFSQASNNKY